MTSPPSSLDFASAFRAHVAPRLRDMIYDAAPSVAEGSTLFSSALSGVVVEAYRMGAGHLSAEHRDALEDGLAAILLHEVSNHQEATALVERLIHQPLLGIARRDMWRFVHGG